MNIIFYIFLIVIVNGGHSTMYSKQFNSEDSCMEYKANLEKQLNDEDVPWIATCKIKVSVDI